MSAYYNEHDPKAAGWLRELIKEGHIAPGDVDERSIEDVTPIELAGYTQCHFFAGIGVWSYALRLAGWPDDKPVWTGSCPCQPFSAAGEGKGFADERHLWPAFFWHIRQCRPRTVFGEQVASRDGLAWLDVVSSDLEAESYTVAALDLCVAGFGAPHIRQRLFFVANSGRDAMRRSAGCGEEVGGWPCLEIAGSGDACGLPNTGIAASRWDSRGIRSAQEKVDSQRDSDGQHAHGFGVGNESSELEDSHGWDGSTEGLQRSGQHGLLQSSRRASELAYARGEGSSELGRGRNESEGLTTSVGTLVMEHAQGNGRGERRTEPSGRSVASGRVTVLERPGPTNGHWSDPDWLFCRDGLWRPVETGTFPLAHGSASRMGRLRGYGNAISPWVAKAFIEALERLY